MLDHEPTRSVPVPPLCPAESRQNLPIGRYLDLRLAEGMAALEEENAEAASLHFGFIIEWAPETLGELDLLTRAHLWKAVAEQNCRRVESALHHAKLAHECAARLSCRPLGALSLAVQGSLQIEKERFRLAQELLTEAQSMLAETGNTLWLANVEVNLGQIALEEGRYESALANLEVAARLYRGDSSGSKKWTGALARCLLYSGRARRWIAARYSEDIDSQVEERRHKSGRPQLRSASKYSLAWSALEKSRAGAFADFNQSAQLFEQAGQSAGSAEAITERGFVWAGAGEFERAAEDADLAASLARKAGRKDLLAHVALLQSEIALGAFEEGLGENPTQHLHRALERSRLALNYALQTPDGQQDRQLQVAVYLSLGTLLQMGPIADPQASASYCRKAGALLCGHCRNHLYEMHQRLLRKSNQGAAIDLRLIEWSQGIVKEMTFQEMTEEFAELVIPKIWEREGRNISRVVAKLSISPKKVRRILSRTTAMQAR